MTNYPKSNNSSISGAYIRISMGELYIDEGDPVWSGPGDVSPLEMQSFYKTYEDELEDVTGTKQFLRVLGELMDYILANPKMLGYVSSPESYYGYDDFRHRYWSQVTALADTMEESGIESTILFAVIPHSRDNKYFKIFEEYNGYPCSQATAESVVEQLRKFESMNVVQMGEHIMRTLANA